MDAFALPLLLFTVGMAWLLVEVIRGSFDDPYPRHAGVTWALTCPAAGLLFGVGVGSVAFVFATVSALALGSLGYWFLATETDGPDSDAEAAVDPEPGPSDDVTVEIPDWAKRVDDPEWAKPKSGVDWDAFDRVRIDWEREFTPKPVAPQPEKVPQRELAPART